MRSSGPLQDGCGGVGYGAEEITRILPGLWGISIGGG